MRDKIKTVKEIYGKGDMLVKEYKDIIKAARTEAGLTQKAFCEYFHIPLRTYEDWEAGRRKMPSYVLRMILYQLRMEGYVKSISETILDEE